MFVSRSNAREWCWTNQVITNRTREGTLCSIMFSTIAHAQRIYDLQCQRRTVDNWRKKMKLNFLSWGSIAVKILKKMFRSELEYGKRCSVCAAVFSLFRVRWTVPKFSTLVTKVTKSNAFTISPLAIFRTRNRIRPTNVKCCSLF